jgi:hypothetical protein
MKRFYSTLRTPLLFGFVIIAVIGMVWPTVSAGQEFVAYWPFDESNEDASGNAHRGKVKGVARYVEGKFGKAFHTPNGKTVIEVAMTDKLRFWDTVTVTFWVYLDKVAENQNHTLIEKNGPGGKNPRTWGWAVNRLARGRRGLFPQAGSAWFHVITQAELGNGRIYTDFALEAERWYHLVGSYDGQTVRVYADGQLHAEVEARCAQPPCAAPMFENNKESITIGGTPRDQQAGLHGRIDEMAIFHGVLTEAQIKAAMTQGIPAALAVDRVGKLATTFGKIKQDYGIAD